MKLYVDMKCIWGNNVLFSISTNFYIPEFYMLLFSKESFCGYEFNRFEVKKYFSGYEIYRIYVDMKCIRENGVVFSNRSCLDKNFFFKHKNGAVSDRKICSFCENHPFIFF